tara:strand:- start:111 stop:284 length:174 start_codon:yes stop_codon:yes gene_type:complete
MLELARATASSYQNKTLTSALSGFCVIIKKNNIGDLMYGKMYSKPKKKKGKRKKKRM